MLKCQAPLMFNRTAEALLCFYGVLKGTNNQSNFSYLRFWHGFFLLSTAAKVSTAKRAQKASAPLCLTTQRGAAVLLKHLKGRRSDSQLIICAF